MSGSIRNAPKANKNLENIPPKIQKNLAERHPDMAAARQLGSPTGTAAGPALGAHH